VFEKWSGAKTAFFVPRAEKARDGLFQHPVREAVRAGTMLCVCVSNGHDRERGLELMPQNITGRY
jgi:hypothetical protein